MRFRKIRTPAHTWPRQRPLKRGLGLSIDGMARGWHGTSSAFHGCALNALGREPRAAAVAHNVGSDGVDGAGANHLDALIC